MARACPSYRLRAFLSVDLVGSTAFKVRAPATEQAVDRRWVKQINHFYLDFPENCRKIYDSKSPAAHGGAYKNAYPRLWKTLGDELVLCARIVSHEHLAIVVSSFVRALKDYGSYLDNGGIRLDVKGAAWIAPFPEPNITVQTSGPADGQAQSAASDQIPDEAFEADADMNPRRYDFLGRHIDAGFRVSRHARTDFLPMSVELAYLLAEVANLDIEQFKFVYEGRHTLKGVVDDRPYPVVGLDTERNERRRAIRGKERALRQTGDAKPNDISDFLRLFMEEEGVDAPVFPSDASDGVGPKIPGSYDAFAAMWRKEEADNVNSVGPLGDQPGEDDAPSETDLPVEVTRTAQMIAKGIGSDEQSAY